MLSNLCELAGMGAVIASVYTLGGRGPAELVGGAFLVVIGFALDGIRLPWRRKQ